jgi:hypothetical protein
MFIICIRTCEQNHLIARILAKPELNRPEATFHSSTRRVIKKQKRIGVSVYKNGTRCRQAM